MYVYPAWWCHVNMWVGWSTAYPDRAQQAAQHFISLHCHVLIQSLSLVCWSHILYINMKGRNHMPIDRTIRTISLRLLTI